MMREDERMPAPYEITIERGAKRVFAGANAWPGWCRGGRTEEVALEALLTYGRRYAKAIGRRRLGYVAPTDVGRFRVVERLTGNATTDFGAPGVAPRSDDRPVGEEEARRLAAIMKACWSALDRAAAASLPRSWGTSRTQRPRTCRSSGRGRPRGMRGQRSWPCSPPGRAVNLPNGPRGLASCGRPATSCGEPPGTCSITRGRSRTGLRLSPDRVPIAAQCLRACPPAPPAGPLKRSALQPKPFGKDLPGRPGPWTQQNCFATRWSGGRATST